MQLRDELWEFLGPGAGRRVVVVGIGSPIRMDDAVGLYVLDLLGELALRDTLLLRTETVPESYTGAIRAFEPTHVLLLDAANFGGEPGDARIIPTNAIAGSSMSTHSLPLNILVDYLSQTICGKVALIGIQGWSNGYGEGLTPKVEEGAKEVAQSLGDALSK